MYLTLVFWLLQGFMSNSRRYLFEALSPQNILVVVLITSEKWKAELTSKSHGN